MLLALWSDSWGTVSASVSVSVSLSFTHSHDHDGGHGHHKHFPGWFDRGFYRVDDDYWAQREEMLRRHLPKVPEKKEAEEVREEVRALEVKHDRLLEQAQDVTDLPSLADLTRHLDELSAQILDIQLQSDDEALSVLLLC